jgi:hypothetical protein
MRLAFSKDRVMVPSRSFLRTTYTSTRVADFDSHLAVFHEFIEWNLTFGLEIDIHENVSGIA